MKCYGFCKSEPGRALVALIGLGLLPATAFAQEETAEPPAVEAPATAEEPVPAEPAEAEAPPAEEPAPVEESEPPPAEEPAPEPVAEEVPAAAPEEPAPEPEPEKTGFNPSFTVGVGMRTGLSFALSGAREGQVYLDDGLVDQIQIRPFFAGSLTENLGFFTQFEVGTANGLGHFAILDAIAQVKVVDEFQIWVGQHIPAMDRNNNNGPFFANGWNFPLAIGTYPFDVGARDRGVTFWGLINEGMVKYKFSVVDLQPGQDISRARYAGRLVLHLFEPENFYYNSATYYGAQDVLTVGATVHGQQNAVDATGMEVADSQFLGFNIDAMFEKNLGKAGTITAEGAYYNFENTGANYAANQGIPDAGTGVAGGPYPGSSGMGFLAWLTPEKIGVGYIQPNARFQYGEWAGTGTSVFDLGLAYVVDGFNHKYHVNYRHAETDGNPAEDILQVGFQYQMAK